jgi:TonB family protein
MANALVLFVCLALLIGVSERAYAQAPDFDAIASRLAGSILLSSRGLLVKPSVLVMDFMETHGRPNEMETKLSRDFSKSLAKDERDFVVADPNGEFEAFKIGRLPSGPAAETSSVDCSAGQPEPTIVVDGYLDELQDRIIVRIKATRIADEKTIFDERITLPLTPELQALESEPLSAAEAPSSLNGLTWVRPGFRKPDNGASVPLMNSVGNSYSPPRCLECPRADYPDSAMAAKIQGVISLRILVDATGQPAEIIVSKGLPCGMNERAVETVAKWKFEPAKGPDGKPVAVWQDAELSFQLSD